MPVILAIVATISIPIFICQFVGFFLCYCLVDIIGYESVKHSIAGSEQFGNLHPILFEIIFAATIALVVNCGSNAKVIVFVQSYTKY